MTHEAHILISKGMIINLLWLDKYLLHRPVRMGGLHAVIIVHMQIPWVKNADDFTNVDKEKSERSGRYFQREWFQKYEWLIYNRETNRAFCKTCATYHNGVFGNYEVRFGNWKKGTEKFKEHEESHAHKIASAIMGQQSISSVCSSQSLATQQLRREGLISHFHTLKTLLRQGVPIRGNTDLESNIYQFDPDKARGDKGLKLLLDEKHYVTVHDVLMEQEQMLVLNARKHLINNILSKAFYFILSDESSDVSKKEQLSFSVRICNENYEVSEDFVGIYECSQGLSSDALLHYTKDILLRCGMSGERMAAMSFDGAAAMKALARLLKADVAPNAIFIHCFAHCNELIVKDASKLSNLLSSSLNLCQSLYAIIGAYSKRILLFEEIQNEFKNEMDSKATAYNVLRLQSLSATRWTTRVKAADVVFLKTAEVRATLEMLLTDSSVTNDTKARIRGILERQLSSVNVVFNLNATRKLVVLLEKLSREFQTVDITAEYALFSIRHVIRRLEEMRSEEEFEHILNEVKKVPGAIDNRCEDRQRKLLRWMNDGEMMLMEGLQVPDTSSYNPNTEQMRRSYYAAIDAILTSLNDRFEQEDLFLLKTIEQILLNATKTRGVSLDGLTSSLVDKDALKIQLDDLPTILGLYNIEQKTKITEVTQISTIAEIFNAMPSAKKQCSEVHKLIMLYYTVPLASASCERTFSCMRRLKTWLRSNSGENHLNNIMFANIEKQYLDMVNINQVACEFSQANERRIKYFGKY